MPGTPAAPQRAHTVPPTEAVAHHATSRLPPTVPSFTPALDLSSLDTFMTAFTGFAPAASASRVGENGVGVIGPPNPPTQPPPPQQQQQIGGFFTDANADSATTPDNDNGLGFFFGFAAAGGCDGEEGPATVADAGGRDARANPAASFFAPFASSDSADTDGSEAVGFDFASFFLNQDAPLPAEGKEERPQEMSDEEAHLLESTAGVQVKDRLAAAHLQTPQRNSSTAVQSGAGTPTEQTGAQLGIVAPQRASTEEQTPFTAPPTPPAPANHTTWTPRNEEAACAQRHTRARDANTAVPTELSLSAALVAASNAATRDGNDECAVLRVEPGECATARAVGEPIGRPAGKPKAVQWKDGGREVETAAEEDVGRRAEGRHAPSTVPEEEGEATATQAELTGTAGTSKSPPPPPPVSPPLSASHIGAAHAPSRAACASGHTPRLAAFPTHLASSVGQVVSTINSTTTTSATSSAALAALIVEAQQACADAALLEATHRVGAVSSPSLRSASVAEMQMERDSVTPLSVKGQAPGTADAVFFAEAAQLQQQSARETELAVKAAATLQLETSGFLRLLGPHAGLASVLGERYTATPAAQLVSPLVSLLEVLVKEEEGDADQEEEGSDEGSGGGEKRSSLAPQNSG